MMFPIAGLSITNDSTVGLSWISACNWKVSSGTTRQQAVSCEFKIRGELVFDAKNYHLGAKEIQFVSFDWLKIAVLGSWIILSKIR